MSNIDTSMVVRPPTQAEIDAKQQELLDSLNEKVMETDLDIVALALILLEEVNALRANAGLSLRTKPQLKSAHRAKLNEIAGAGT